MPVGKKFISAAQEFLTFVNQTGSPFHSVKATAALLDAAGFKRLNERVLSDFMSIKLKGRYYITRNHSSILAFIVGRDFTHEKSGIVLACSHTDSPALRVRSNCSIKSEHYELLGVETYGGGLWHTWFDRGLGIAGKAVINRNDSLQEVLVRIPRPLFIIPNLAIHLQTSEERSAFKVDTEKHLRPVVYSDVKREINHTNQSSEESTGSNTFMKELIGEEVGCAVDQVVEWDMFLFDATESRLAGRYEEFVESPRLDNLVSVWASFSALCESAELLEDSAGIAVAAAFDHEEVGSKSFTGADSSILETWLRQIVEVITAGQLVTPTAFPSIMSRSFLLSFDGAHAVHPNYVCKHQGQNKPLLHKGIVMKENCNQRYCSHASSMAIARQIAKQCTPACSIQDLVVRNDSPCGSTIGPMTASRLGVRGVDIGVPQLAMHSIRETCGTDDLWHMKTFVTSAFLNFRRIDTAMVQL